MANLLSGGGEPSSRDKEPRDVKDENERLDVSEFELPDFEDGSCPCCMQKFGNQDKVAWLPSFVRILRRFEATRAAF